MIQRKIDQSGEIAARLGSIDTFDRLGEVSWLDDFEAAVLHWNTETAGAGAAVVLSTVYSNSGNQSVKLTAGSDGAAYAGIHRDIPLRGRGRIGGEIHTCHPSGGPLSPLGDITFDLFIALTDSEWGASVKYDAVNWNWYYYAYDPGPPADFWWELLGHYMMIHTAHSFNFLKLVVDIDEKKYVRFNWNGVEFDLSGFDLYPHDMTPASSVQAKIRAYSDTDTGDNGLLYVDDFILTQNEP